ncbi:unnamed protein product [Rotaria sp. Silwood2]|nr:unnamed protein product [Rotaria sp. Silwood2]CAF3074824.1 unnamed protein product [Rotaria sp. Silwood2]CAF3319257.1 unnamed protein product [Rotaria sp. Silwood2]CAF3398875.1 unnamed protein product [Rotaria sp. Silwood2]CAF4311471.1 unnamed protein product [Rotaria sp. Silwood2]
MNYSLNTKNMIELVDLPDEMVLTIMNKIQYRAELLCSIIGIGNNHLEQLALDKCNSIDLTFDFPDSPYELLIQRFCSHVMPRIYNNIQSLTLSLQHILRIITFANENCDGTLPNLTHLKIILGKRCFETGTPYTLGNDINNPIRCVPLFSIVPQLVYFDKTEGSRILSVLRCSPLMRSITSFELDDDCMLPDALKDDGLLFAHSSQLTHIRITLCRFDHCIRLLSQLGVQLYSFSVSIVQIVIGDVDIMSRMVLISCPNLKILTMAIYRNIHSYEECIPPLLQRLSNVEDLTLLLAVGANGNRPNHFIDGFDIDKDIVSYMPYLRQFNFHIRSILKDAPPIEIETIRQSFVKQQQQAVDCVLDHFNNHYGQCQIYSLPFIGTRLDFISNRFSLFNTKNTFSMVTVLLLFDDVKPFESIFFEHVTKALPHLRTLEVSNQLEQQEKTTNKLGFAHLITLILYDVHMDYVEQLLFRARLPCLVELAIRHDLLLAVIAEDNQQAKDNCSKIETLRTTESPHDSIDIIQNFFPLDSYVKYLKNKSKYEE